ncbi:alpha/beta hydrolase [Gilvimarinus sp. SDUM040013]|uniref:Alpha/beta hydrolase n=1 Tax=Gilvimarinus gilvus TaxID=3058038 RepID=A0ABU4RZ22_9GAMM|nr:alpha/beta hydrolase [Gilvimarinus sp. SDUM040013]MDO3386612.1 alpha/beta hydrolase [Gilvimarinus sp. SDUM040013]MDX6849501.1 alpha/beta hydrolase [Gilvimarinus sp. SDUM040013]
MKLWVAFFLVLLSSLSYGSEVIVEHVAFDSHGVTLRGSLALPSTAPSAAVVFVHGSGKQARNMHWAERFAKAGVAALVYDKRGAGKSGGAYEGNQSVSGQNISLLTDDAIAALNVLRKHARTKDIAHGLTGISQAGWIVPLAAEQSRAVDFMVLWSGPVTKVSEEDIYSKYTSDLDGERVPSYSEALKARTREYVWPEFLGTDTDPTTSLEQLSIPGLWVFGEQDGSIPVDLSVQRLRSLIKKGHSYEYVLFSSLGHNNMEQTFSTVADWINRLR